MKVGYTEAFKMSVVQRIVSGEMTRTEVARVYDIRGTMTLSRWIKKYGSQTPRTKETTMAEKAAAKEIRRLRAELQQTKKALAEMTVRYWINEEEIKIIERDYLPPEIRNIKKSPQGRGTLRYCRSRSGRRRTPSNRDVGM